MYLIYNSICVIIYTSRGKTDDRKAGRTERMKHLGMTNGQLRALLEAIRIINDLTEHKHDLDEQLVRIQNSIDKGVAQPAKTESDT